MKHVRINETSATEANLISKKVRVRHNSGQSDTFWVTKINYPIIQGIKIRWNTGGVRINLRQAESLRVRRLSLVKNVLVGIPAGLFFTLMILFQYNS